MVNKSDIELWKSMQNGDENAFAQVYYSYAYTLHQYGQKLGFDNHDIEDAIHDLFVKLHEKRGQYTEVKSVKAYLIIALKNTLMSKCAQDTKVVSLEYEKHDMSIDGLEDEWIAKEMLQENESILDSLLSQLSPRQREVIYFRYFKEMSFKEIANTLHINTQSAKNVALSAMKKIKTLLMLMILIFPNF